MASRLLTALACLALCHCNPVLINDYIFRDDRGLAIGQAQTIGYSGQATGSASSNSEGANAYSSASTNDHSNVRYGEVFPEEGIANSESYMPQYGSANAVAQAQMSSYYNVPVPATIVSYEQTFEAPQEYGINSAESTSISDGNSAITSSKSQGLGYAQANGIGSFGITSSNANSFGMGSASSSSNNMHGTGATATKTQGFGSAYSHSQNDFGSASSDSQSNGGMSSASSLNSLSSNMATANSQGFGTSNAHTNDGPSNFDNGKYYKKIGWHVGTSYNVPSHRVHAGSQSYGGSAKSSAYTNRFGNTQTSANTQGYASANSNSNNNGYTNSVANSNGFGHAKSTAGIGPGYINSHASSIGHGYAQSSARGTNYGSPRFGHPHSSSNAQTNGSGTASSSVKTQGVNAFYRVADSNANSYGSGAAQANAYSS